MLFQRERERGAKLREKNVTGSLKAEGLAVMSTLMKDALAARKYISLRCSFLSSPGLLHNFLRPLKIIGSSVLQSRLTCHRSPTVGYISKNNNHKKTVIGILGITNSNQFLWIQLYTVSLEFNKQLHAIRVCYYAFIILTQAAPYSIAFSLPAFSHCCFSALLTFKALGTKGTHWLCSCCILLKPWPLMILFPLTGRWSSEKADILWLSG